MFLEKVSDDTITESTNVIYINRNVSLTPTKIIQNKVYDLNFDRTGLLCWWCCHSFETVPVYLPTYKYNKTVYCKGYFCSYNCAMAHCQRTGGNTYLLNNFYRFKMKSSDKFLRIKPAYPRESLKAFGGILDIDDYRKEFDIIDNWITYTEYPIIHQISQIKKSEIIAVEENDYNFNLSDIITTENKFTPKRRKRSPKTKQEPKKVEGKLSSLITIIPNK
jgi:uncharacterized protein YeeX (DUF496 family)